MAYLELDDIIKNVQKYGGATTYWNELSARLPEFIPGPIIHSTGNKYMRLYSPGSDAKIFHSSHFRVSSSRATKNVTTIHDLIFEKGLGGGRARWVGLYERRKSVLRADAIICISESTRRDLLECYGRELEAKPVYVIPHGCTRLVTTPSGRQAAFDQLRQRGLDLADGAFFLFVGARAGYKNFALAVAAFAHGGFARQGLQMICTGTSFNRAEQEMIAEYGLAGSVHSIGFVGPGTIGALYSVARALVYPSAYEGFGLPPLEAMAAGCPVICANSSSLPEVVGDSGILIDPRSAQELAMGMAGVLEQERRSEMIRAGGERAALFDWRETARKHAQVYESLVSF